MTELEKALHDALMDSIRECQKLGYNPTYTLRMINSLGGVGTCKRMLNGPENLAGFKRLMKLRRLDLTFEAIVLRPEFAPLFTETELSVARGRLAKLGYSLPEPSEPQTSEAPATGERSSGTTTPPKPPGTPSGSDDGGGLPAPPPPAPEPVGYRNSSITRVRPYFRAHLVSDDTGRTWLPKLLRAVAQHNQNKLAADLAGNPGRLSAVCHEKRPYPDADWGFTIDLERASSHPLRPLNSSSCGSSKTLRA